MDATIDDFLPEFLDNAFYQEDENIFGVLEHNINIKRDDNGDIKYYQCEIIIPKSCDFIEQIVVNLFDFDTNEMTNDFIHSSYIQDSCKKFKMNGVCNYEGTIDFPEINHDSPLMMVFVQYCQLLLCVNISAQLFEIANLVVKCNIISGSIDKFKLKNNIRKPLKWKDQFTIKHGLILPYYDENYEKDNLKNYDGDKYFESEKVVEKLIGNDTDNYNFPYKNLIFDIELKIIDNFYNETNNIDELIFVKNGNKYNINKLLKYNVMNPLKISRDFLIFGIKKIPDNCFLYIKYTKIQPVSNII
ncbi:hypothetical protein QLL95_gp0743 [Cotonvirus japonicus]|uniref:Uncharacterized protein n=1 Tax=Cotonvirus japonicus TaxID=2811091 RepID=A0ABM7NT78_9VIRU|nr:hypothetical protein QLL95_gp0743 [Cotonvirus japonicus]BCS83380.1 hypothetical protein [Cotonvirus japonicus]